MAHPLLEQAPGAKRLLLGNEAIVRGAVEAGLAFAASYPGTPSSEVPDTLYRMKNDPEAGYDFQYSVNEKTAVEFAGGASLAGALSMTTMKHVGLNVALDPYMTLGLIGTPGGFLILSADDPGCHSSQNEQDNRLLARFSTTPVFEPASAQEAKDMTREALLLSRKWEQPMMLRTTTRLNHLRGPVVYGERLPVEPPKPFVKDPRRFTPIPAVARARRPLQLAFLEQFREEIVEKSPWNTVRGEGRLGVIVSGMARTYVADALERSGLADKIAVLELGLTHPLPQNTILAFVADKKAVLVVEELEPVLETEIRALLQRAGSRIKILGKAESGLSRTGELDVNACEAALRVLVGLKPKPVKSVKPTGVPLPMRPPSLCAGCSHRALYHAVRKVFGEHVVHSSDIGCYTLGIVPPLSAADFLLCMGSSISAGAGFSAVHKTSPTVAFIGDSTFFHSGITGLVDALHNKRDLLVVVLDNHTTAMTGHQPHPGVEQTAHGPNEIRVDIEAIVRAVGVTEVISLTPFNTKKTQEALKTLKDKPGVRVLIAREPCALFARRTLKKKPTVKAAAVVQDASLEATLAELACPAFVRQAGAIAVDPEACTGCMVCTQLTPSLKAVKA